MLSLLVGVTTRRSYVGLSGRFGKYFDGGAEISAHGDDADPLVMSTRVARISRIVAPRGRQVLGLCVCMMCSTICSTLLSAADGRRRGR